jgi:DNA helicase-2/ATP-dependent DNA helicase PcrA
MHDEGALLLLAGAGSGKTRVVTARIARLLSQGHGPHSILALTFTNRAAKEMRERVAGLLGMADEPPVLISTFHSLGARMLREHGAHFGRSKYFSIYDEDDQVVVLRQAAEAQGLSFKVPQLKRILRGFARAKNAGQQSQDAVLPSEFIQIEVEALGREYESRLARADAFDFGDLILRPAQLLEEDQRLAFRYRSLWRWVLVDEFQDTNAAQYKWLKQLAPPGSNLFVVGDDDQSIYGWRGAEVGNILDFPQMYTGAKVIRLEQNYRSQRHILDAANGVIQNNQRRLGKNLWTDREGSALIELQVAEDGRAEANYIAGRIAKLCAEEDLRPSDIAVLMRANHLSLDLEICLRALSVPYKVVRGRAFFERAEIRDALSYVRLLVNTDDEAAFRRAVAAPARGVGKASLTKLDVRATASDASLWTAAEAALDGGEVKGRARTGLTSFVEQINRHGSGELHGVDAADRVQALLTEAGLIDLAPDSDQDDKDQQRQQNIARLLRDLQSWGREQPDAHIADYLEQVKLVSDADAVQENDGAVSLMTIHAAKGLEFPVVFVLAMEEGVFPHANAIQEDGIEEERRLCYVAITRAEERLVLTRARRRHGFQEVKRNPASRFLSELPAEVLHTSTQVRRARRVQRGARDGTAGSPGWRDHEYSSQEDQYSLGMSVWHAQFGAGKVLDVTRGARTILRVSFADMEPIKVVSDFVSPYEG